MSSTPATPQRRCVVVCQNRTCQRSQAEAVLAAFQAACDPPVMVTDSGCMGQCGSGPMVRVLPDEIWYCRVRPDDVAEIVEQHLHQNQPVQRLLHPRFHPKYDAYSYNDSTP